MHGSGDKCAKKNNQKTKNHTRCHDVMSRFHVMTSHFQKRKLNVNLCCRVLRRTFTYQFIYRKILKIRSLYKLLPLYIRAPFFFFLKSPIIGFFYYTVKEFWVSSWGWSIYIWRLFGNLEKNDTWECVKVQKKREKKTWAWRRCRLHLNVWHQTSKSEKATVNIILCSMI